ncbi:MAG TPA: ankyrin repeat domain-containing protein [Thermoplasmata archaeon]
MDPDLTKEFFALIKSGEKAKVDDLLRKHPDLIDARTKSGASPILFALYAGHPNLAEHLASRELALDVHEAASLGKMDRLRKLVAADPQVVNAVSEEGFPPLGLAAYLGQAEAVKFLLSKGSDVNFVAPATAFTALTGAVAGNHKIVVELLLAHGANVNHVYEDGLTPLSEAAANGNAEIVKLLLANGANVHAKTKDGKTALAFALERGHCEVADLLRQRGGTA